MVGLEGADGAARADAVVTWSGAYHLEIPNKGQETPDGARTRYIGCAYGSTDSCTAAWNAASPYHNCCQPGNVTADTPFLIFNSENELVQRIEPDTMYADKFAAFGIRVTKIILDGTAHAGAYKNTIITLSGCVPADCDELTTNDPWVYTYDGNQVKKASADFFLGHL